MSFDMMEMVKNVVRNLRKSREKPPPPLPLPPSLPVWKPPPPKPDCDPAHYLLELYCRPCLVCEKFCNCGFTYNPEPFPDIIVRSMDKKLVQLSGNLVRSSAYLREIVELALKDEKKESLVVEQVVIEREPNVYCEIKSVKKFKDEVKSSGDRTEDAHYGLARLITSKLKESKELCLKNRNVPIVMPSAPIKIRDSACKFHQYKRWFREVQEPACPWDELIEINGDQNRVLVLFDTESDKPTLGINADVLTKVEYYISMHLEEVERRLEARKRLVDFRVRSRCKSIFSENHEAELDNEETFNTLHYEDWEEEFFSVDYPTFYDIHQANQELIIWDLHYALEKWICLGRGFPQGMVNGWIDYDDPRNDRGKKCIFGLWGMYYTNVYRRGYHRRSYDPHPAHREGLGFIPKWWWIRKRQ